MVLIRVVVRIGRVLPFAYVVVDILQRMCEQTVGYEDPESIDFGCLRQLKIK